MISAGDPIVFRSVAEISRESLKLYAEASGDPNPIHLDDEIARGVGLPGVIAHGMLVAAHLSIRGLDFAQETTGRRWTVRKFNSRFRAMVFPGEPIACGGTVKAISDDELVLDLQARNAKGETTTTGSATLIPVR